MFLILDIFFKGVVIWEYWYNECLDECMKIASVGCNQKIEIIFWNKQTKKCIALLYGCALLMVQSYKDFIRKKKKVRKIEDHKLLPALCNLFPLQNVFPKLPCSVTSSSIPFDSSCQHACSRRVVRNPHSLPYSRVILKQPFLAFEARVLITKWRRVKWKDVQVWSDMAICLTSIPIYFTRNRII